MIDNSSKQINNIEQKVGNWKRFLNKLRATIKTIFSRLNGKSWEIHHRYKNKSIAVDIKPARRKNVANANSIWEIKRASDRFLHYDSDRMSLEKNVFKAFKGKREHILFSCGVYTSDALYCD